MMPSGKAGTILVSWFSLAGLAGANAQDDPGIASGLVCDRRDGVAAIQPGRHRAV